MFCGFASNRCSRSQPRCLTGQHRRCRPRRNWVTKRSRRNGRSNGHCPFRRQSRSTSPADRLTRQPQEGQHSAAEGRDPGPIVSGEGCRMKTRRDAQVWVPCVLADKRDFLFACLHYLYFIIMRRSPPRFDDLINFQHYGIYAVYEIRRSSPQNLICANHAAQC